LCHEQGAYTALSEELPQERKSNYEGVSSKLLAASHQQRKP
jgi:hypothetical protein